MSKHFRAVITGLACVVAFALSAASEPRAATATRDARETIICPTQEPPGRDPRPRPTCTPVPVPADPVRAALCVRLAADGLAPQPGTYRLTVTNVERGRASRVQVWLPASEVTLVETTFSRPTIWVSERTAEHLELTIESLAANEATTATLTLATNGTATEAAPWRIEYAWRDAGGRHEGVSGRYVTGGEGERALRGGGTLTLAEDATAEGLQAVVDGFAAHENVGLWWHRPGAAETPLGSLITDREGSGRIAIADRAPLSGAGYAVAGGECSGVTATAALPAGTP